VVVAQGDQADGNGHGHSAIAHRLRFLQGRPRSLTGGQFCPAKTGNRAVTQKISRRAESRGKVRRATTGIRGGRQIFARGGPGTPYEERKTHLEKKRRSLNTLEKGGREEKRWRNGTLWMGESHIIRLGVGSLQEKTRMKEEKGPILMRQGKGNEGGGTVQGGKNRLVARRKESHDLLKAALGSVHRGRKKGGGGPKRGRKRRGTRKGGEATAHLTEGSYKSQIRSRPLPETAEKRGELWGKKRTPR